MSKINNQNIYVQDVDISDLDFLIGTNGNTNAKTTKNYSLGSLKNYFRGGSLPSTGVEGSAYLEKTKAEMDVLISTDALVPNTLYKISGVHPSLYDDGTTSGTTIYLRALTTNTLSKEGHGEFYNPKYDQSIAGFGIWDADGTYNIEDKVIWGGYSWTNVNGLTGAKTDVLNLDSEWTKNSYDETNYNKAIDIIEYDYENDWINRRYESQHGNNVEYSFTDYYYAEFAYSAISVFMFGNGLVRTNSYYRGVSNSAVTGGSYFECVDFRGRYLYNTTLKNNGYITDNLFIDNSYLNNNTITNWGSLSTNIIINSGFYNNTLLESHIQSNTFTESNIDTNALTANSYIQSNTLMFSSVQSNTLINNSKIDYNTLTYSTLSDNNLTSSGIQSNTLLQGSIVANTMTDTSLIYSNSLINNARIQFNIMHRSNLSTQNIPIDDLSISTLTMQIASIEQDITSSSILFDGIIKTAYQRPDGTTKLRYYDNYDLLVIADITD